MTRGKKNKCRSIPVLRIVEEEPEENIREEEETKKEGKEKDGEEESTEGEGEDNDRDSLILFAFVPLLCLAFFFHQSLIGLSIFIIVSDIRVRNQKRHHRKMKEASGEIPMRRILKDTVTYKEEIEKLRQINEQLDFSTAFNLYLEMTNIAHSVGLLLYSADAFMIYPLVQIIVYFYFRLNLVNTELYQRFFSPLDVYEALIAELGFKFVGRLEIELYRITIVPCPNPLLIFPVWMAILQCVTTNRYNTLYANERRMRHEIRIRFNQSQNQQSTN